MLQAEHRGTAPPAGSVRQNCRPDCRSPWARRVVLRMALTCTRLRRTSTTTGAAGNSDQKDAEATLDVSSGDGAPRARCAAATRPSGADITARDSCERREALCSNVDDIPIGRFRRAPLSTGRHTCPLTLDCRENTRPSLRASVEQSTEKEFRTRGAPTAGESDARRPATVLARYRQGHNASTQLHRTGRKNLQHNGVTTDILLIRHPHARWQNERSVRGVNHILYKVFGISPRQISAGERTFDRSPE